MPAPIHWSGRLELRSYSSGTALGWEIEMGKHWSSDREIAATVKVWPNWDKEYVRFYIEQLAWSQLHFRKLWCKTTTD